MARGILKQQLKSHQLIDAIDKAKSKPTKKTPVTEKTVEEEKEIIEAAPVTTKVKSNKKSKKSNTKKMMMIIKVKFYLKRNKED